MEPLKITQLVNRFQLNKDSYFTGRMDLRSPHETWSLFFRLGRLVWATGGIHRFRRWYRLLRQCCPELPQNNIQLANKEVSKVWEYLVLIILLKRQRIKREQAIALIEQTITEVLFDIIQTTTEGTLTCRFTTQQTLEEAIVLVHSEQILNHTLHLWQRWVDADLATYSPNLAPVLQQPDRLRGQLSEQVLTKLETTLDGQSTLRDIAATTKQNLLLLTGSIINYVHKNWIELQPIADLVDLKSAPVRPISTLPPPAANASLIACVDDNLNVCRTMERILTLAGYRFIAVQDPLKTLPTLLEHKPDLIFLDLVMPIASGYEICAQIRRVSAFKNTPVVILTGNDGIVDRVRAKLVGASDFLAKPVDGKRVVHAVRRHLLATTVVSQDVVPS
ncbi:response regulator [Oscillatoria sp. FACHB-1407]|uniref:response regulator n=1 Tax=Oscillatoria sp. FACHB-1407 TaxID=2692847 RepID=UPI00168429FC|nr:response regulator [Oscillatoria sp. FACHB-1407]MBD2461388.1 response regulator [Oscillatoria sp. FACHB-1407]